MRIRCRKVLSLCKRVRKGDPLLTLHTDTPDAFESARRDLDGAWEIGESAADRPPLVIDRVVHRAIPAEAMLANLLTRDITLVRMEECPADPVSGVVDVGALMRIVVLP